MASFPTAKIVLHAKILKDGRRSIALRATFNRQTKHFFLRRYCFAHQWDAAAGRLTKDFRGYKKENEMLAMYEARASDALRTFERDGIAFSFTKFEQLVFASQHAGGATKLVAWLKQIEQENRERDSPGNAHFYKEAARAVSKFRPNASLSDVDGRWLQAFERWASINLNRTPGGMLTLMTNIRAGCKRAVADGIMPPDWNPFPRHKLTHLKHKKAKKGAPLEFFRALAQLIENPEQLSARQALSLDLFLFSFYCRGMNLADIAALTPDNIQGGRIVYVRQKTGQEYSMRLNEKADAILRKYRQADNAYLFPIYQPQHNSPAKKEGARRAFARSVNRCIREVAALIGWEVPGLSFYTARHSYADILKKAGVSVEVISEALGHADIRTTDAYLKGFGDSVLDEADKLILN